MPEYVTVIQAAESLGLRPASVRRAITEGRLKARKFGRDYQIAATEVEKYRKKEKGSGGRPRKAPATDAAGGRG